MTIEYVVRFSLGLNVVLLIYTIWRDSVTTNMLVNITTDIWTLTGKIDLIYNNARLIEKHLDLHNRVNENSHSIS